MRMSAQQGEAHAGYIAPAMAAHNRSEWHNRGKGLAGVFTATTLLVTACTAGGEELNDRPMPTPSTITEAAPQPTYVPATTAVPTPTTPSPSAEVTPTAAAKTNLEGYTTVYFQPLKSSLTDAKEALPHVYKMVAEPGAENSWTGPEKCDRRHANDFLEHPGSEGIHRIVAFSLGRVAVAYMLNTTSRAQQRQITEIIVVDPGNLKDMRGVDTCDPSWTSTVILNWLDLNANNRLTVIAGERTAQNDHKSLHAEYLSGVHGAGDQVTICTDPHAGHPETWQRSKGFAFSGPRTKRVAACPQGFTASMLQR